jgi:tetratricopeptide (TPR) repeat protein
MGCLVLLFIAFLSSADNPFLENARLHPESFSANHLLGEYYLNESNFSAAIPYLEKARELDPSNYTNSYDLALAYLRVKAIGKSHQLVNGLIKQEDKAELHNLLGDINEADGKVDEAAREYESAARMDPSEKNLFDLGSDLLNHRGLEPALKVFDFGIQRYPQSARLRVGLGVSYYSLGRYDDAVQTLCQAVDLDPKDTRALDFLGKMIDISPQYASEVTKRLSLFVRNYPTNAAAQYYYALSIRKRTVSQSAASAHAAEPYLLHAVELKPDFTEAHYELGILYQDLYENRKAIEQFEIATKQRPNYLQAHYHLARLYDKEGKVDLARREFSRIETLKAAAQK